MGRPKGSKNKVREADINTPINTGSDTIDKAAGNNVPETVEDSPKKKRIAKSADIVTKEKFAPRLCPIRPYGTVMYASWCNERCEKREGCKAWE